MKTPMACASGVAVSLVLTVSALAVGADSGVGAAEAAPLVYKPPMRGAPASRVGGATRGTGEAQVTFEVLAPDHTGLTTQARPTLYWYTSGPVDGPVEVTLLLEGAEKPVLERKLSLPRAGGIHAVPLEAQGVTLRPEVEYEWFVSVVRDPAQRSLDTTAGGAIRHVVADPATRSRIASASERARPALYAEAGLWYDAFDAVTRLIERHPSDAGLRAQRAALLEQVGLTEPAAKDRAVAGR
jgi:hypothetical protein